MSHILACTDGSAYSASVCEYATWAARRLSGTIEVLHVLDHHRERAPGMDLSGSLGLDASEQLTGELVELEEAEGRNQIKQGKAILDEARKQLAAAGMVEGITVSLRHGNLVDTLEEREPHASLVVIGARGHGAGLSKTPRQQGSHLERVLRSSIRPVLVVQPEFQPVQRFLLACDGGPSALKAIRFLISSPLLAGCACDLLRAGSIDDKARSDLGEAAGQLRSAGYEVTTHAISGAPEAVIAGSLIQTKARLLVMGAYGHSPIRQLFLGSTTAAMLRTSPVPVLMFK